MANGTPKICAPTTHMHKHSHAVCRPIQLSSFVAQKGLKPPDKLGLASLYPHHCLNTQGFLIRCGLIFCYFYKLARLILDFFFNL